MDNPIIPRNSLQSSTTWQALSADLQSLLTAGRTDQIGQAPALLAECERALAGLRADVDRPAEPEEIKAILGQRFAVFTQPARTDGEWAAWWADYTETLAGLSAPALEAAMAGYVREPDSEFFPKPGRIRELARTLPNRASRAYYAAQRAVSAAHEKAQAIEAPEPEAKAPDPQDRAKVQDMLAQFRKDMAARQPAPKPERPPTPVKIDEHGLSEVMRAHMSQQRGEI